MGRYTKPPNGLARLPNGLAGRSNQGIRSPILDLFAIHDHLASTAIPYPVAIIVLFCYPRSLRKGLFARILHRFCARTVNLYLFAILALQILISSRGQHFFFLIFTSSQSLISLQLALFARAYLFAIFDLFAIHYFFATLHLFDIFNLFARTAILHLFARTFSSAIFIAFASFVHPAICLLMGRHTCKSPNR